jgi:YVTN family beta-propeller protein
MKRRLLLVLALATGAALLSRNAVAQPTVIATVGVGDQPSHVAVNLPMNRIYVSNFASGTVSVIDGAANVVVGDPIPVGVHPRGVAANSSTGRVYVANAGGNSVSVLDGVTNTVVGDPIAVGHTPWGIAVNPSTNRVYVANRSDDTVSVIDGATNAVLGDPIGVGSGPLGVAVEPITNTVFVANEDSHNVSVIDGATNAVVATSPVGFSPGGIAANSSTGRVYVANSGSVVVLDATTYAPVGSPIGVPNSNGVAVNAALNRVYVTDPIGNAVAVIDGADGTVVETVSVGDGPYELGVNSATNRVFVANFGDATVSVIEDLPEAAPEEPEEPEELPPPLPGETEDVPLQGGVCNPVATTYPDNTPIGTIADAVAPIAMLDSLWEFEGGVWMGWSPEFPEASDLTEKDFLDVVFICVGGSGPDAATFTRPLP